MNLLSEILERIEFEHLLSEVKNPTELLNVLSRRYGSIPQEVIGGVIGIDPTKKGSYTQWVLSKWDNEKDTIISSLENGRLERLFEYFHENNDSFQIKDFGSIGAALDEFVPEGCNVLVKSNAPTTILKNNGWVKQVPSELANDFDIVFNDDEWVIAVPNTYEADCKLGENMYWCTAGGRTDFKRGRYYYNEYLDRDGGKYYVNFDMSRGESRNGVDYPFTRYQFHFESHQFKDLEDEDVDLYDIGMPDSARDFYISEGYDESDFMNEYEKAEHYDELRGGCSLWLNDDLYLGIEYNHDYEFEEPDESTSFYLFSTNDDIDPISWNEFPNPHYDDSFIIDDEHKDSYIVLKSSDCYIIAAYAKGAYYYSWDCIDVERYIKLNGALVGIDIDSHVFYYSWGDNTLYTIENINIENCENIFTNDECGDSGIFIEFSDSDGFHSLFVFGDDGLKCVIKKDIPANGSYYAIDESGVISGKYGYYRIEDIDDEEFRYHFDDELSDGIYIVSRNVNGREIYNIVTKWGDRFLFENWYNDILYYKKGIFVVKDNDITKFIDSRENQIGRDYGKYGFIGAEMDVLVGVGRTAFFVDFINVSNRNVVATFKCIVSTNLIPGNDIIIVRDSDDKVVFYNYKSNSIEDLGLNVLQVIGKYSQKYLYCYNEGSGSNCIINVRDLSVVVNDIVGIKDIGEYTNEAFVLDKVSGKKNVFTEIESGTSIFWGEVIPEDVDGVINFYKWPKIISINNNGRYYLYQFKEGTNKFLINPNGFRVPGIFDDYNGCIIFSDGDIRIGINSSTNKLTRWDCGDKHSGYHYNSAEIPMEVLNFYNEIIGNSNSGTSSSVNEPAISAIGESFIRFMKRIDEADKLRRNVIYD